MVQETKQPTQQGTQPTGTAQAPQTGQPSQVQTQTTQTKPGAPVATTPGVQPSIQPVKKKSKWWIWLIIALVVIGAAVAAYFIFIK